MEVRTVMHLSIGFGKSGAETMLYQTLKYRKNEDISYHVLSLGEGDYYEQPIRGLGILLITLSFRENPEIMDELRKKAHERAKKFGYDGYERKLDMILNKPVKQRFV